MLVLNDKTRERLEGFIKNPQQSFLLVAPKGMGKTCVAEYVFSRVLGITNEQLKLHPYFLYIKPNAKGNISIDEIRELKHFLRLKTSGKARIRRALLISGAESMTLDAQNALLKTLEEPPADTLIALTAADIHGLLPTVVSRALVVDVLPPGKAVLQSAFSAEYQPDDVARALLMSDGRPGLMYELLNNENSELVKGITKAKELLTKSAYERLIEINELSKTDNDIVGLLEAMYIVLHTSLLQNIDQGNLLMSRRLESMCQKVQLAQTSLVRKPSTKLLLTDLFLQL